MTGEELSPSARDALAELLLTLADDEFELGFWDSEGPGIDSASFFNSSISSRR